MCAKTYRYVGGTIARNRRAFPALGARDRGGRVREAKTNRAKIGTSQQQYYRGQAFRPQLLEQTISHRVTVRLVRR